MEKLTIDDSYLILDIFFSTAKKLIIEMHQKTWTRIK